MERGWLVRRSEGWLEGRRRELRARVEVGYQPERLDLLQEAMRERGEVVSVSGSRVAVQWLGSSVLVAQGVYLPSDLEVVDLLGETTRLELGLPAGGRR